MRLDPDCIRDILLAVEEITDFNTAFYYPSEEPNEYLGKYSSDKILYHLNQCNLSGLLHGSQFFMSGDFMTNDLSPKGHEFINDIRSNTNWNKTKTIATKVGSFSLDTIKDISTQVIAAVITNQMNQLK